jgi:long-chain acyl-CoA synthetase
MTENYLNILADTIRNNWDQPALTDFYLTEDGTAQDTLRGNHYTYGEMYAEICRVANLLTSLGLQKGDHIAICGANSAHWVIAYLAIAKMQGVSVTVMHTLMPDEIARLVAFSDAKALFADEDLWGEISPRLGRGDGDRLSSVISLADWSILRGEKIQISNLQSSISKQDCTFPQSAPDDLAQICFTSGTSGKSKGVMLSYKNISVTTECVAQTYPPRRNKKILSYFPLAHAFGLGLEIVVPITRGCRIFLYRGELRAESLMQAIRKVRPYLSVMVPTMVEKIAGAGALKLLLFKLLGIEYIVIGGSGLSAKIGKKMKKFRIPIAPGYGMTETVALICLIVPSAYREGTSGRVCNALTLRISPSGEILVKGENVMLGYYKDPEATARKIDSDGWLHTGDKGHLDEDGYLYVEGRLEQDIIVLPNGENIRPDNIEALINALPEVSESIVLARDGHLVAIVVPATPSSVSSASSETRASSPSSSLRRKILRTVNPSLPLFSQLYDVEITDQPLARTEKQTLKRYLYS